MRKELQIIIGESETGKSSIIRALTGIHNHGPKPIMYSNRVVHTYQIWTTSSQESGHAPEDDVRIISERPEEHFLLSLRMEPHKGCPNADSYIQEYLLAGFIIKQIVILGDHLIPPHVPGYTSIHSIIRPFQASVNSNASEIRRWWSWL